MKPKEVKFSLFLLEKIEENICKNEILSLYLLDSIKNTKEILQEKIKENERNDNISRST